MVICAVYNCNNSNKKHKKKEGVSFHSFPALPELRSKWIHACGRTKFNEKYSRLCSEHFCPSAFKPYKYSIIDRPVPTSYRPLKVDAIPTLKLPSNRKSVATKELETVRSRRQKNRANKKVVRDLLREAKAAEEARGAAEPASTSVTPVLHQPEECEARQPGPFPSGPPDSISQPVSMEGVSSSPISVSLSSRVGVDAPRTTLSSSHHGHGVDAGDSSREPPLDMEIEEDGATSPEIKVIMTLEQINSYIEKITELESTVKKQALTIQEQKQEITAVHKERMLMRETIQQLYKTKKKNIENEVTSLLSKIFTPGQIKMLTSGKRVLWTSEDIAAAIALHGNSAKSYRYMRKLNHPLPGVSTLKRWASKITCEPGILFHVLQLMKLRGQTMLELQRLCCITFDEVHLSQKCCYDQSNDQVIGPFKQAQVVMARGLVGSWKQPVYYDYDQAMTKEVLLKIIEELYKAGFMVVSVTSDMGGGNQTVLNDLGVSTDNVSFKHPVTGDDIFYFADVPHLLKLIRNHFIDEGFSFDKANINIDPLVELLQLIKTDHEREEEERDIRISYKFTDFHLTCKKNDRQKVKLAAQLCSHTNSTALKWTGERNMLKSTNWQECAEFLKLVNDWFDVLNVRFKYHDSRATKQAYGLKLEEQKEVLHRMIFFMENMRVVNKTHLYPFQKGVIITSKALILLYENLSNRYLDLQYILTYRLNQDVLENFFSIIRAVGMTYINPLPLEFKYRMRNYILSRNPEVMLNNSNVAIDKTSNLPIAEMLNSNAPTSNNLITEAGYDCVYEVTLSGEITENLEVVHDSDEDIDTNADIDTNEHLQYPSTSHDNEEQIEFVVDWQNTNSLDLSQEECMNNDSIYESGLLGIAGYIAHRLSKKFSNLGYITSSQQELSPDTLPDWVNSLSEGGLMHPSDELCAQIKIMDAVFVQFHGKGLNRSVGCCQEVCRRIQGIMPTLDERIIKLFVRTRLFIRIRHMNRKLRPNSFDTHSWERKKNIFTK